MTTTTSATTQPFSSLGPNQTLGVGYVKFADVASSFEQVQKDFANRPLFGDDVSRQVDSMTRRWGGHQQDESDSTTGLPPHHPSPSKREWSVPQGANLRGVGGTTNQVDVYDGGRGGGGPAVQQGFGTSVSTMYRLPPQLHRPTSVEDVLTGQRHLPFIQGVDQPYSAPNGIGPPPVPPTRGWMEGGDYPPANQPTQQQQPQLQGEPAGVRPTGAVGGEEPQDREEIHYQGKMGRRRTRQRHHQVLETVGSSNAAALTGGRNHHHSSSSSTVLSDGTAARNGDDDEEQPGGDTMKQRGVTLRYKAAAKDRGNGGGIEDLAGIFSSPERNEERWVYTGNEVRVQSQIERAAMRCRMQQERLQKQGGLNTTMSVGIMDGSMQTEEVKVADQYPERPRGTSPRGEGSSSLYGYGGSGKLSETRGDSRGTMSAVKTPSTTGLVFGAPGDYKPAIPESAEVGQWHSKGVPSADTDYPSTGAVVTAATVGGGSTDYAQWGAGGQQEYSHPTYRPGGGAATAGRDAVKRATQGASYPLMQRLDQLQLSNEELLIKNKAVDDSTVAGRETVRRVAEGNRRPPDQAAQVPLPRGGYGSLHDDPAALHNGVGVGGGVSTTSQDAFSPSRWQGAKIRNEVQHLEQLAGKGDSTTELRKFAMELPTQSGNSAAANSAGSRPRSAMRAEAGQPLGYNARKKWSNVSFSTPLERQQGSGGTLNPIEELSHSAKQLLSPVDVLQH